MSKTSYAARCSRGSVQGVLRALAEGEGGVAHREGLAATASATLERSAGTVAHGKRAARERRRRRSKVSRRRPFERARHAHAHAPPSRARSNGRRKLRAQRKYRKERARRCSKNLHAKISRRNTLYVEGREASSSSMRSSPATAAPGDGEPALPRRLSIFVIPAGQISLSISLIIRLFI